jgi:flagellar biosynthesis protein FliR
MGQFSVEITRLPGSVPSGNQQHQIPVYFLATPFVMLGGLLVMYFAAHDYVLLFMEAFSTWLRNG